MGGTTAKTCLIQGGRPTTANVVEAGRVHRFKHGSGLPIKVPVVDMIEIGAGGGSIAWHDALGLLKVGPVSAGADPGPASYGLGGAEPTVTDACLRLGYFDPDFFLGGRMALGPEAASNALTHLGDALDLETEAVAWGVYRVVCENMAQATRVHIIEQGHDPRNYQLMAFGGAGPAHAARVAHILGAPEVIVPQHSGVVAALGFLVAPASFEFTRSYPDEVHRLDWGVVDRLYQDLECSGPRRPGRRRRAGGRYDLRAAGRYALFGAVSRDRGADPPGTLSEAVAMTITTSFEREYAQPVPRRPARLHSDGPQLAAAGPRPRARAGLHLTARRTSAGTDRGWGGHQAKGTRRAYFPERGWVEVTVFDRTTLASGSTLEGPVIVEEAESTTVVNPGDRLSVDALGNLRIEVEQS